MPVLQGPPNWSKLQWNSTGHRSSLQFSVHLLHLRRLQLVVHQASSILEDNDVQHPVQIVQIGVDVSPVNLRAHTKGQKKLVSVNVRVSSKFTFQLH